MNSLIFDSKVKLLTANPNINGWTGNFKTYSDKHWDKCTPNPNYILWGLKGFLGRSGAKGKTVLP